MADDLTKDITNIVDRIFEQKEEMAMRKETEMALSDSADRIVELAKSLEKKDTELGEAIVKIEELEVTVTDLSGKDSEMASELEKVRSEFEVKEQVFKDELGVANAEKTKVEGELISLKKDEVAKKRFEEMKLASVAATSTETIELQVAKIREMGDADFKSYKQERVDLRESVMTELKSNTAASDKKDDSLETAGVVNPASSINPMKAVSAMLNLESAVPDSMVDKYENLGKELAKKYINSND